MSGRVFIFLFLGFTAVFAVALWYFQTRGHLEEVTGVDTVTIAGVAHPVTGYKGIDADTSPLRMRGCFQLSGTVDAPEVDEPTPLTTAGWFDCFDVETLTADLEAGQARAVLAEFNEPYGFNRVVAIYPDGRAFQWRQMNECGKAQADGGA
ncbi:MAG: DUF6446 family protein, partial [Pikeienuella sp.]